MDPNPCLTCGACCATFRVSFFWGELASHGGTVPDELVEAIGPFHVAMCGSNQTKPRCIALEGTIGESVRCVIHPQRATVCRIFPASGEEGLRNPRCEEARAAFGLPPILDPTAPAIEDPP